MIDRMQRQHGGDRHIFDAGCLQAADCPRVNALLAMIKPNLHSLYQRYPAPVVFANVETSSCITDALYGALACRRRRAA
jgi:N-methylhydantoinase B/oxoprolinase/acetone carboxylase alpha subunit